MDKRDVKIRYLKSFDFKTTLATGVYGGLSPNGLINANFFTDRIVIPESETIKLDETGTQIGPSNEVKNGDIIREIHHGVLIDVNTAKVILNWLQNQIKEHEKFTKKIGG